MAKVVRVSGQSGVDCLASRIDKRIGFAPVRMEVLQVQS